MRERQPAPACLRPSCHRPQTVCMAACWRRHPMRAAGFARRARTFRRRFQLETAPDMVVGDVWSLASAHKLRLHRSGHSKLRFLALRSRCPVASPPDGPSQHQLPHLHHQASASGLQGPLRAPRSLIRSQRGCSAQRPSSDLCPHCCLPACPLQDACRCQQLCSSRCLCHPPGHPAAV